MQEKIQQGQKDLPEELLSDLSEDDERTSELTQQAKSLQIHTYSDLTSCIELLKLLKDQIDNKNVKSTSLLLLLKKISISTAFTLTNNQLITVSRLSGFLLEGIVNIQDISLLINDAKIVPLFESIMQRDLDYVNANFSEYVRPLKSSIQGLDWGNIQKSLNFIQKVPRLDFTDLTSEKSQPKTAATDLPDKKDASALEDAPTLPKFYSGSKSSFHVVPSAAKHSEDDLIEQITPRVHFS